jgi:hypothetical protein
MNLNKDLSGKYKNLLNIPIDVSGSYAMKASEKSGIDRYMMGAKKNTDNCLDEIPVRGSSSLRAGFSASAAKPSSKQTPTKNPLPLGKYNQDQTDKIYDLERENTTLKSKENLLETEIVKMKTKLRRIDELMKKKRTTQSGADSMLPAEIQK